MKSRLIIAGIGAAMVAGVWMHGHSHGQRTERLHWQGAQARAVDEARQTEQKRYGDLLNALNNQYLAQRDIADRLNDDLDRLRDRPPRIVRVPGDPAPDCKGATGAELSGPDAQFLARLAAQADRHRAALAACYAYADSLQGGQ